MVTEIESDQIETQKPGAGLISIVAASGIVTLIGSYHIKPFVLKVMDHRPIHT